MQGEQKYQEEQDESDGWNRLRGGLRNRFGVQVWHLAVRVQRSGFLFNLLISFPYSKSNAEL